MFLFIFLYSTKFSKHKTVSDRQLSVNHPRRIFRVFETRGGVLNTLLSLECRCRRPLRCPKRATCRTRTAARPFPRLSLTAPAKWKVFLFFFGLRTAFGRSVVAVGGTPLCVRGFREALQRGAATTQHSTYVCGQHRTRLER